MEKYINHIEKCLEKAEKSMSKINQEIISLDGMSGTKTRHFYNNILSIDDARYLEIGTWKGSSVCSAMFENQSKVLCIDNWSQFNGPKNEFLKNFEKYKGKNDASYIESDCFNLDLKTIKEKFNIYLYDGDHSENSHYLSLKYYLPFLEKTFIFIVDDWNWDAVRKGTYRAIDEFNLKVLYKKEILLTNNNKHTHEIQDGYKIASETWWNGICAFVLEQ